LQHRDFIGGSRYAIGNHWPGGHGRGETMRKVSLVRIAANVDERDSRN